MTIRELDATMTAGPWVPKYGSLYPERPQPGAEPLVDADGETPVYGIWPILAGENAHADAEGIAAIRNALPLLAETLEAAAAAIQPDDHAEHYGSTPHGICAGCDALDAFERCREEGLL